MIPGWTRSTLGEICRIEKGKASAANEAAGEYPLVTTSEERKTSAKWQFEGPAVCIPMISAFGHGKPGLKRIHYQEGKFALASILSALLIKDANLITAKFLCLFLSFYKDQLIVPLQFGAANMSITIERLATVPIWFPSLPEQERIVRLLDEAEFLRTQRTQANERMEDFVPALFEEMFGDPAINPKKWEVVEVRSLLKLCEYGTSQKANEEGIGLPVLRMGNVTFEGDLDLTNLKYVKLSDNEAKKQLLENGDVLFNRTNSRELVGKTGMWDGRFPAYAASYFIRMRFDSEKEHPQHFTTFMNLPYMKKKLVDLARGAVGQANINAQELQSIEMPVPPLTLQWEFAERVKEAREVQSAQGRSTERVEALYQSMLDRAFKGEL